MELSQKSLLAKARERPDLVREVVDRARREGIRSTGRGAAQALEETPVGYSSAGRVIEVGEAAVAPVLASRLRAPGRICKPRGVVSVPANLCARYRGVSLQAHR